MKHPPETDYELALDVLRMKTLVRNALSFLRIDCAKEKGDAASDGAPLVSRTTREEVAGLNSEGAPKGSPISQSSTTLERLDKTPSETELRSDLQ